MNVHAWRLPLFALLYIATSYLAAGLATCVKAGTKIRQMSEMSAPAWDWIMFWIQTSALSYYFDWFTSKKPYALPLWLICGLLFFLIARRYWRSGQARDGWCLAGITLLWSAGSAELFFWMYFMLIYRL